MYLKMYFIIFDEYFVNCIIFFGFNSFLVLDEYVRDFRKYLRKKKFFSNIFIK